MFLVALNILYLLVDETALPKGSAVRNTHIHTHVSMNRIPDMLRCDGEWGVNQMGIWRLECLILYSIQSHSDVIRTHVGRHTHTQSPLICYVSSLIMERLYTLHLL